ncbi:MAG: ABC transporter substrate-binding protein [Bacillota bacterium]
MGVNAPAAAKITIVHWQHHHEARTPVLQEMAREFEKTHPDVSIKVEPIPYDSYFDKLITSLSSGIGPDVFQIPISMGQQMARSGMLVPVPEDVLTTEQIERDYVAWTISQFKYKNEYYGLPTDVQTLVLFINNKLYREAGFDPAKPPKTWKEFEAQAVKGTKKDASGRLIQAGLDTRYKWAVYQLFMYQRIKGDVVDVEAKKVRYDGEDGLAAWQFVADLMVKDGVDSPEFLTGQKKFEQGRAMFYINHPVTRGRLARECPDIEYTIAPVPSPDGTPVTVGHHWAYVVSKRASNQKVAWEWVQFLTGRQGQLTWCTKAGDLPSLKELIGLPELTADANARVCMDSMLYARPCQQVTRAEVDKIHATIWDSIVLGKAAVSDAVKAGAAQENQVLARVLK